MAPAPTPALVGTRMRRHERCPRRRAPEGGSSRRLQLLQQQLVSATAVPSRHGRTFAPPAVVPSELGFAPVAVDAAAVEQLDVNGYTVLENVIDAAWLEQMRAAFEALSAAEGRLAGHEARENLRYVRVRECVCARRVSLPQSFPHTTLLNRRGGTARRNSSRRQASGGSLTW